MHLSHLPPVSHFLTGSLNPNGQSKRRILRVPVAPTLYSNRYVLSRFMALYLTENNVALLILSRKTSDQARKAAEKPLRSRKDS